MNDAEFLEFIYNRLMINGDKPEMDFMIRLKELVNRFIPVETPEFDHEKWLERHHLATATHYFGLIMTGMLANTERYGSSKEIVEKAWKLAEAMADKIVEAEEAFEDGLG